MSSPGSPSPTTATADSLPSAPSPVTASSSPSHFPNLLLPSGSSGGNGLPEEGDCKRRRRCSDQSKVFKIEISFAAKIPMKALESDDPDTKEALRVLNIILRQHAAKQGCLVVYQSFFTNDAKSFFELGGGLLGFKGIHSSFRITHAGLSLNMDVSATVIIKPGPVIDFLMANQNVRSPCEIDWRKGKHILKNLRVKILPLNKELKITGLSKHPCNQQLFRMKPKFGGDDDVDGVKTFEMTVYDYFLKHCHTEVHYSAHLPCIDVGRKSPVYYPLEFCFLVSMQRYTKALSSNQRYTLIEGSGQKPQERINILTHALRSCKYDADAMLRACNISINHNLMKVKGRVLSAPKLKVGNGKEISPCNGRWSFNDEKLYEPVKIRSWAAVNFSTHNDLHSLCQKLIESGLRRGIHIEPPLKLFEEDPRWRSCLPIERVHRMFRLLKQAFPDKPPEFILCLLPSVKDNDVYGPWKRKCLSDYGIATQCVASRKINSQCLNNILLKINGKLGGLNFLLDVQRPVISFISEIPTIILGMDVCRGPVGHSNVSSITAVVGSRKWPSISHYSASLRLQLPQVEIIDSLFQPEPNNEDKGIIRDLLQEFYKSSGGRKPEQMLIFRNGVEEPRFNEVLNIELDQVIKACKLLYGGQLPKVTVIIAQKKHQTRFFLDGSFNNVPPGTIVDGGVCHPKQNDFYICPHLGFSGTTRPRHYHVLLDEIGFSSDDLHELVHSLSYVYQRSTTVISEVAPVRYAHLAAAQMAQMINPDDDLMSRPSSVTYSMPELPKLHKNVCNNMFFC